MPSVVQSTNSDLLPASMVRRRYGVSDMTVFRWVNDQKLGFPQPIYINTRRYWRLADLEAFEARQAAKREAA
ncbi:helix-turn-helix transcriptional regulator [Methylobacterium dankookense]|uniref:Helix-turn-helix domain-containing protein n=1 Tax=Methylobacterium dankookense TaxID=560405 RepID=A0A564G251_9HYPH|nr:transcriptional regulator [Methylobacterium dankookense]GJD58844.1 hypothetical protein IFDJLNFL_4770 [Methylobacterium dankookense]VUF14184.1 hypothetical protein MTDSW087_03900 [Methylobacterium dankookense]